ncbi:peptide-methionine (S)-S-oxide reductase MsrA [Sphingomonas panacisoli]|uniref:Peptide methionine sulfoxide reductase MsrA n=1 Tax=Sphingomonas panacisoli TaxID=1813879 RepID=A0A5B8LDI8_9SPHN|nr:peptide-methionine (S)-S-oxide reductase MsrA [Sphingomonas panacisoli]QDZ06123.1 peptide-methionine (S)-S-oxide reductase MsrA [Sphingomonas panacisoli]
MIKTTLLSLALTGAIAFAAGHTSAAPERAVAIPAPARDVTPTAAPRVAVFAGGCFWGVSAVFERVKGVTGVTSGYAGGTAATATYDQVSTETTGHAEAVRITYDPRVVSYGTLLRVYFSIATDPTSLNRQGPDAGPSYRSAIFPQNDAQRGVAAAYIAQLTAAKAFPRPIVTKLETGRFFPAEDYHQRFYDKNPNHPYIVSWDKPKVAAFKTAFPQLAK